MFIFSLHLGASKRFIPIIKITGVNTQWWKEIYWKQILGLLMSYPGLLHVTE